MLESNILVDDESMANWAHEGCATDLCTVKMRLEKSWKLLLSTIFVLSGSSKRFVQGGARPSCVQFVYGDFHEIVSIPTIIL